MTKREFRIKVMGKTLEHLGSQLYRQRPAALAELVANSWDAGARNVWLEVPEPDDYAPASSQIVVTDDGEGMTADDVEEFYLVVGRNRRVDQSAPADRRVMGRKGIGKLAGFGIATRVELLTWRDGQATRLPMDMEELKLAPGEVRDVPLEGEVMESPDDLPATTGTRVTLSGLRQVTALDPDRLVESLARRFSRTVRGEMKIHVNGTPVGEPEVEFEYRVPLDGWATEEVGSDRVRYFYGFSPTTLKNSEMRGFVVYVRGKTAQAPPYFFDVEATATAQHGTKYLFGAVEADFLDEGEADEDDVISTDRQEVDWETPRATVLKEWGQALTRRALREWRERREEQSEEWVLEDPDLSARIGQLDAHSRAKVTGFVRTLGQGEDPDRDRVLNLAGALVAAFEYQHFHDLISDIEEVGDDPELLSELLERILAWKVLESRAILEIVDGRLSIVDRFGKMVAEGAPERAPVVGVENLHDLITAFPWLLNPDWQVFEHERELSSLLRDWADEEANDREERERVDFLALSSPETLVVVEIKRPQSSTSLDDLQRLQRYMKKLESVRNYERLFGLLVTDRKEFRESDIPSNITVEGWSNVHTRVRQLYEHYRGVLRGEVSRRDFQAKRSEVAATRQVLNGGAYLDKRSGKPSLGQQDADHGGSDRIA